MKRLALFAVVSFAFALAGCEGINAHYTSTAKDGCCAMPAKGACCTMCKNNPCTCATCPMPAAATAQAMTAPAK